MSDVIDKIIKEIYISCDKIKSFKIVEYNIVKIEDIKKINDFVDASSGLIIGLISLDEKNRDDLNFLYNDVKLLIKEIYICNNEKFDILYNKGREFRFYVNDGDKSKLANAYRDVILNIKLLLQQKLLYLYEDYEKKHKRD